MSTIVRIIKSKKQIEKSRQLALEEKQQIHLDKLELFKEYTTNDNVKFPAPLFYHLDLRKKKMCPVLTDNGQGRDEWLRNNKLVGVFKNLYSRLYEKSEYHKLCQERVELYSEIDQIIREKLTIEQLTSLDQVHTLLDVYTASKVKSKKNRDQYNNVVNILTRLVKDTNIDLHTFLGTHYKTIISVGTITKSNAQVQFINDKIHSLVALYNSCHTEERFVTNIRKSLDDALTKALVDSNKKQLELELREQDNTIFKHRVSNVVNKNWSALSSSQRETVLSNYAYYHVNCLSDGNGRGINSEKALYDCLVDALSKKKLLYKDIKWNKACGRLDLVKTLYYENSSGTWIIRSRTNEGSSVGGNTSIITSKSEKKINDMLLKYLYTVNDKQTDFDSLKLHRNHIVNYMMDKLDVKKLSKTDKDYLYNQTMFMLECLRG